MDQLLSIQSIPIRYELSVTPARIEYNAQKSQVMENRVRGGLHISNKPAKLALNTLEARKSMYPTPFGAVKMAAQKGMQTAQDSAAQCAQEGRQLLEAKPGDDVLGQIIAQRSAPATGDFQLDFIPAVGPDIQYVEPTFEMQYQADKLQFDTRVSNGNVQYVPGDISMNVTQWPDVVIEYMGKPIYVPPSASERFVASA